MGFLGTRAEITADFTLLLQIVILFVLLLGYKLKMDKRFRRHGITMSLGVVLHVISILLVMIPSLISFSDLLITEISTIPVLVTWIHALIGLLAVIVGLFLIVEWRFRYPPKMTCAKRRPFMKPLFTMWTIASLLGIVVYVYAYLI